MSIAEIIKKAKENPLQAFAWTMLTICVGFIITSEATFPDRAEALEKANVEITASQAEIERARKIVDAYRETCRKIAASGERSRNYIDKKFPDISTEDTKMVRAALVAERQELNDVLAQINTTHFENKRFVDLFHDLQQNVNYTDDFLTKRVKFLDLILTDFDKAREMRPSMEIGVEEDRKFREVNARDAEIDTVLERARFEHNAKVRTAQRKADLYKTQSKLKVAAFTYIGGFLGAWGVILFQKLRKRKDSDSVTEDNSQQ